MASRPRKIKRSDQYVNGKLVEDEEELSFRQAQPLTVKPDTWHTIVIEVRGDEMLSTLDGKNPVFGTHPIVGIPKGILSFGTSQSASYRNLRVFEALPNPEWVKNNAALSKDLPATNKTSNPQ